MQSMARNLLAEQLSTKRYTLSDGTTIPLVGLGTYRLTGVECEKIVRLALDIGYRHIDTALVYDNQPHVARALIGHPRGELYLTSKLWIGDHTTKRVPLATEQILRELQTDYLDLLLIHWPDRAVPFEETLRAMDKLRQEGKVISLGVSNFTIRHLKTALKAGVVLVTNQVEFHPFLYQLELQRFCAEHGLVITAHTPLGRGNVSQNKELAQIGAKYGKSAVQVGLRWLLQRGCIVIPKSATPERLRTNAELFDFELAPDDLQAVDGLHADRRLVKPEVADFD
jgi:2,5-diketo-D-gluconate reductase B